MLCLNTNIPFVRAALGGSLEEAALILQAAERRHGLRWSRFTSHVEASDDDDWYAEHLMPFLSETHFVLSGGDVQSFGGSLVCTDGHDRMVSWRHWGEILAEWANQHWMARPGGLGPTAWTRAERPWEYLDFYSHDHLSYLIQDYDRWLVALGAILSLPSRAQ